jgi:hypothetical protein
MNKRAFRVLTLIRTLFAFAVLACASSVMAQSFESQVEVPTIPAPLDETFKETPDELISPARYNYCFSVVIVYPERVPPADCKDRKPYREKDQTTLTIYRGDGSVFYVFGRYIWPYDGVIIEELGIKLLPAMGPPVLRLKRESDHWYEVEVNIDTGLKKYVLKSDPRWARTDYGFEVRNGYHIKIDPTNAQFYDRPNGNRIELPENEIREKYRVVKTEGEFAFVEYDETPRGRGQVWLRYRKGPDLIVGTILTFFRLPPFR